MPRDRSVDDDRRDVNEGGILICYDGSSSARRGIDEAAKLLGPRRAVVLDVGPPLTAAEHRDRCNLRTSAD